MNNINDIKKLVKINKKQLHKDLFNINNFLSFFRCVEKSDNKIEDIESLWASIVTKNLLGASLYSIKLYLNITNRNIEDIIKEVINTTKYKGNKYGNAFRLSGIDSIWAIIKHKFYRAIYLESKKNTEKKSLEDTYKDIFVYTCLINVLLSDKLIERERNEL